VVPRALTALTKKGVEFIIESGAGQSAGYPDEQFKEAGANLAGNRSELFARAEVVLQVRAGGANPEAGAADIQDLRKGQVLIGMLDPLGHPKQIETLAQHGVTAFALELLPRITRAQSMDVLSSMATIAGYKAVILAAERLPKIFPMMMTAAGTITAAKVFVLGVGVAGLQAIATAKRLGAVVEAYDIRPEVRDQVKSVGGKFIEIEISSDEAGDAGGYAKAQSEDFYAKQRELMFEHIRHADLVITTAAVPGRKAPILVTADMIEAMKPGSIVVDLAAETGGNCEPTEAGQTIEVSGTSVIGPVNIPATVPFDASQMYAKNITTFLSHLLSSEGPASIQLNLEDQIIGDTLVAHEGRIASERVRGALDNA